jgi:3-oxoacyl-[acyl-carrier-protein] synthase-3
MRLASLSTHIPKGRVATADIVRLATGSTAEARVFERMFGLSSVAVADPTKSLRDHFRPVIEQLCTGHDGTPPDALICVRGLPLHLPQSRLSLAELRDTHPFLADVRHCYEIDQNNCSGLFWALDLARVLMETGVARCVAVLAGDCHAGLTLADRYLPGCTLMGDAFCGLVLDDQPGGLRVGSPVLHSHPEFSFGYAGNVAQMGAFFAAHNRIVRGVLDELGFGWDDTALLLPHNVNRLAWQVFAQETRLRADRIHLGLLPEIGHCYTCDPFLLLQAELRTPQRRSPDDPMTLLSVGMGGFAGGCQIHDRRSPHPSRSLTQKEYVQ